MNAADESNAPTFLATEIANDLRYDCRAVEQLDRSGGSN